MDGRGAGFLQTRIALGGNVGARVKLVSTEEPHLLGKIGEAGEIRSVGDDGTASIHWDGGDESSIDVFNSQVEVQSWRSTRRGFALVRPNN